MPVYRDKNGYYYFSVMISGQRTLRRRDLKGNRLKTRRQALNAEREFLMRFKGNYQNNKMTFYQLYDYWILHRREIWKKTTCYSQEMRFVKHIKNEFPNLDIEKLTQFHFDSWRTKLSKKKLSDSYKNELLTAFKNLWQYADDYYAFEDQNRFAKRLLRIKSTIYTKQKEKITYSLDDFFKFINHIDDIRVFVYICVSYLTGTRVSETLGIKIGNFIHENGTLTIDHQTTNRLGEGQTIDITLKTANSNRIIYLPDWLNNLIYLYIENIHPHKANKEAYLFYSTYKKKQPMSPNSIRRIINKASIEANLPQIDLREMRTSFATFASDIEGIELKTVSKAMGHISVATTARYYDQSGKKHLKELSEAINKILVENGVLYQKCIKKSS